MGKILLVGRLAARDLRQRRPRPCCCCSRSPPPPTTLTLGLVLHGVTSQPYQRHPGGDGRARRGGPAAGPGRTAARPLTRRPARRALARAPGVTGHSGPYPVACAVLRAHGHAARCEAEGRDQAPASVDQPKLTQGSWVRPGGVVVERTFADVLGVRAGDRVTLNGRPFRVAGIAVTAAVPPYPNLCYTAAAARRPALAPTDPGLVWLTRAGRPRPGHAAADPLSYVLNLSWPTRPRARRSPTRTTSGTGSRRPC